MRALNGYLWVSRKHGVSEATIYNWKARYGGMETSRLRRLKELESENARLKRIYAERPAPGRHLGRTADGTRRERAVRGDG
jgi:hypothetical protein